MSDDNTTLTGAMRAFALAGLRLGGTLLDTLDVDAAAQLERALTGGARLVLELSPLPAFERAELVLIEREGRRQAVAVVALRPGPLQ